MRLPIAVLPLLVVLGACSDVQTEPTKPMMWSDHNGDHVRDSDPTNQEWAINALLLDEVAHPGDPKPPSRGPRSQRATRSARYRSAPGRASLEQIKACESHGSYTAVSPSGKYRGAYQFDRDTWASVGGSGDPAAASPEEQDMRAARLQDRSGNSPWPRCGR